MADELHRPGSLGADEFRVDRRKRGLALQRLEDPLELIRMDWANPELPTLDGELRLVR